MHEEEKKGIGGIVHVVDYTFEPTVLSFVVLRRLFIIYFGV